MAISPPDAILACLPTADHLASGTSHFGTEIRACASILSIATSKSLILLDELGRGTSAHEAFGIAYAISEHLLHTRPLSPAVFLATHNQNLVTLLDGFPDVVVRHLAVQVERNHVGKTVHLHFPHVVQLEEPPT